MRQPPSLAALAHPTLCRQSRGKQEPGRKVRETTTGGAHTIKENAPRCVACCCGACFCVTRRAESSAVAGRSAFLRAARIASRAGVRSAASHSAWSCSRVAGSTSRRLEYGRLLYVRPPSTSSRTGISGGSDMAERRGRHGGHGRKLPSASPPPRSAASLLGAPAKAIACRIYGRAPWHAYLGLCSLAPTPQGTAPVEFTFD